MCIVAFLRAGTRCRGRCIDWLAEPDIDFDLSSGPRIHLRRGRTQTPSMELALSRDLSLPAFSSLQGRC